jgi:hypothetical protein
MQGRAWWQRPQPWRTPGQAVVRGAVRRPAQAAPERHRQTLVERDADRAGARKPQFLRPSAPPGGCGAVSPGIDGAADAPPEASHYPAGQRGRPRHAASGATRNAAVSSRDAAKALWLRLRPQVHPRSQPTLRRRRLAGWAWIDTRTPSRACAPSLRGCKRKQYALLSSCLGKTRGIADDDEGAS